MRRLPVAFVLTFTAVAIAPAADAPPARTKPAAAFAALVEEMRSRSKAAEDKAERAKVVAAYRDKLLAHARKYADDSSAVEALSLVLRSSPPAKSTPARAEALRLLRSRYVESPLIARHLRRLVGVGMDAETVALADEVARKNKDKLTRARALFALATGLEQRLKELERVAEDDNERDEYEEHLGKEALRKLKDTAEQAKKDAAKYRAALERDYKGVIPEVRVGEKAPQTVSEGLDGKRVTLADHKGKVVVLDFWATWCPPCRAMIPPTRKLVDKLDGRPFVFVSVSIDDTKPTLAAFLKRTKMPWAHWWDGSCGEAAALWNVLAYPTVFVIDHKGVVRYKQVGEDPKGDALEKTIEKLVRTAEAEKSAGAK